jgi:hypothetical protein
MDEKTAELRDLFVETTGEESVTESQADARGSLSSEFDEETVNERLADLIGAMRERYEFASSLSTADLRRVVRSFVDPEAVGADQQSWSREADAALASTLEADVGDETVFRARMDLHLVSDADRAAPFPFERLRRLVLDGASEGSASGGGASEEGALPDDATLAAELAEAAADDDVDVDAETVRRYRRVVEADLASRRVNHRFRDAFADLLTDDDLSTRLAEDARRDGLEEATEDIETDVSL